MPLLAPLYPILDPSLTSRPLPQLAEALVGAGVELIQLRDKQGSARMVYGEARELVERFRAS